MRSTRCFLRRAVQVVVLRLALIVGIMWVSSWYIQHEFRWMRGGVHLHLEFARGTITYVTTSGWENGDYFVWAYSSDLSYRREADWLLGRHAPTQPWYVRVHWSVIPALIVGAIAIALKLRCREKSEQGGRTPR